MLCRCVIDEKAYATPKQKPRKKKPKKEKEKNISQSISY